MDGTLNPVIRNECDDSWWTIGKWHSKGIFEECPGVLSAAEWRIIPKYMNIRIGNSTRYLVSEKDYDNVYPRIAGFMLL